MKSYGLRALLLVSLATTGSVMAQQVNGGGEQPEAISTAATGSTALVPIDQPLTASPLSVSHVTISTLRTSGLTSHQVTHSAWQ